MDHVSLVTSRRGADVGSSRCVSAHVEVGENGAASVKAATPRAMTATLSPTS
jgi:hypothetical protein